MGDNFLLEKDSFLRISKGWLSHLGDGVTRWREHPLALIEQRVTRHKPDFPD